uniref:Uncharacterized protein n=1 Tax=viral metagenome TaxID=1070528 RepID=A0A6C0BET9_9ZZZZ
MSWTRIHTDSCNYKQNLSENVSQLSYMLDPIKFEHCSKCRNELGLVGGTSVGVPTGNMVDLENNLIGIDRPNTRCPTYKYLPRDDNVVQGKEYIKPVQHPEVDVNMMQLRPCQMFSYHEIPQPPLMHQSICPRR